MNPRGLTVALLGPDGAGKSTLAVRLQRVFGLRVQYMYLGLGDGVSLNLCGRTRLELGLPGYLLRFWLCSLRAQWFRARGNIVLFDRHPCEARLPARRRLTWYMHLSRWVRAHSCPTPDLILVLDVPGRVMHQRKGERTSEALETERRDFLALQQSIPRLRVVDGTRSPEAVAVEAAALIATTSSSRSESQAGRSPRRSAAFMIMLARAGATWRRWAHRHELAQIIDAVPCIVPKVRQRLGLSAEPAWTVLGAEWTRTDLAVIALGPSDRRPCVMLKAAHSRTGGQALERQREVVAAMLADPRVAGWEQFVPRPITSGTLAGRWYMVEQALVGNDGRRLAYDRGARRRLLRLVAQTIGELHERTAVGIIVDAEHLEAWVENPVQLVEKTLTGSPFGNSGQLSARLRETAATLRHALTGRLVNVSWIHGDLWVGNVLARPDGAELCGIVDWDRAQPDGLPMHDILDLLLHTRRVVAFEGELSNTFRDVLGGASWTSDELAILGNADLPLPRDAAGYHLMLVLHWLRHISRYINQYPGRAHNPHWVAGHVRGILRCF